MHMQKTLLRPLFLLLLSLPFSLAAMSESEMIQVCNQLDQGLQERIKQIEQLQASFKDTDTIAVTTRYYDGHEHKKVVDLQSSEHKETVENYKNCLNKQIWIFADHSQSIRNLRSMLNGLGTFPTGQKGHDRTAADVRVLERCRIDYKNLLKSVNDDVEFYEKSRVMKAIPAASSSQ